MVIDVIPAGPAQGPTLANLLELYTHDFTDFYPLELGDDGRFGYAPLPLYWREAGRHAFLVKVDGRLSGFALVKRGSEVSGDENVWDMAEFFIVRGYRRRGIGAGVAHDVWRRFPGPWEVRVVESNHAAREFWGRAIASFTGEVVRPTRFEKNGGSRYLFSFESRRVVA